MSVFGSGLVGGMSGENETFTVVAKSGTLSKYTIRLHVYTHSLDIVKPSCITRLCYNTFLKGKSVEEEVLKLTVLQ